MQDGAFLSMLTLISSNLISKMKSKRFEQKNKSLLEQMFGDGKKKATWCDMLWRPCQRCSSLCVLHSKAKIPGTLEMRGTLVFRFLHKSARNGCLIFVNVPPASVPNVSRCV